MKHIHILGICGTFMGCLLYTSELVSRNQQELLQQLVYKQQRLEMALDRIFSHQQQRLQQLRLRLQNQHPQNQLLMQKAKTAQLHHRLVLAMQRQMDKTQQKLTALSAVSYTHLDVYKRQTSASSIANRDCSAIFSSTPSSVPSIPPVSITMKL